MPVAGEDLSFELRSVENESSLFNKLGISVAAKYGVVSGNASYDQETAINKYSVYFFISGSIEVGKVSVTSADLNAPIIDAPHLSQLEKHAIDGFRQKCGDSFISGISYGGKYVALVEIKTEKDSEIQTIQAAVSGSAGAFSGEANAKARLEAVTQNRQVTIKVLRSAGDGAAIPTTVDGLTKAVTTFPDALKGLPLKKLQPFNVTLEDYISINAPNDIKRSDFSTLDQEAYIEDADTFIIRHRSAIADAKYAMSNPDQFPGIDKAALQNYIDLAEPKVLAIVRDVRKCLQGITKCKDFSAPSIVVVSPPPRTDGPSRAELIAGIAKARAAIDSTLMPGAGLSSYCSVISVNSGGTGGGLEWVGCVSTMNDVQAQCAQKGCRP